MNLSNLLGDDEHTAADGPYKRVMKTRKWVYISATIAALVAGGRYHQEGAFKMLLGVFSLPDFVFATTLIAGLLYLVPLYLMLLAQLGDVYSAVLDERLADQRLDRLKDAIKRQSAASEEMQHWANTWQRDRVLPLEEAEEEAARRLASATRLLNRHSHDPSIPSDEMSAIWRDMETSELQAFIEADEEARTQWFREYVETLHHQYRAAVERRSSAQHESPPEDEPRFALLQTALTEANDELNKLSSVRAYLAPGYRRKEIWIDLLRVIPPVFFGGGALIALAVTFFGPIKRGVFGL